jgi:hypothetical protein
MRNQDDEEARFLASHLNFTNQAIVTPPELPKATQGSFVRLGPGPRIIKGPQPIEKYPNALLRWPT